MERPEVQRPDFYFTHGTDESEIGPGGGYLQIGDNYLLVLPGTVSEPLTFTMTTFPAGQEDFCLGVTITAEDADGTNVESFPQKMLLSLSYEGDNDCVPDDNKTQRNLRIKNQSLGVWLDGGSNPGLDRVWGWTDHLSDFVIGDN